MIALTCFAAPARAHLDRGHELSIGYRYEGDAIVAGHRIPMPILERTFELPEDGPERTQALLLAVSEALAGPIGLSGDGRRLEVHLERLDVHDGHEGSDLGEAPAPAVAEVIARYRVPYDVEQVSFHWAWPEAFSAVPTSSAAPAWRDGLSGSLTLPGGERVRVELPRADPHFTWRLPPRGLPPWSVLLLALGALTLAAAVLGRLRKREGPPSA